MAVSPGFTETAAGSSTATQPVSAPAAPAGAAPGNPLALLEQSERSAAEKAQRLAAAEAEVAAARKLVADLEKQVLAIKNPFAARPELSEEEREKRESDTSVAERMARSESQLDEARLSLKDAEADLARARR